MGDVELAIESTLANAPYQELPGLLVAESLVHCGEPLPVSQIKSSSLERKQAVGCTQAEDTPNQVVLDQDAHLEEIHQYKLENHRDSSI